MQLGHAEGFIPLISNAVAKVAMYGFMEGLLFRLLTESLFYPRMVILPQKKHGIGGQMSELKPCPFCGGKAKVENMGYPHHVYCMSCGAKTTGVGFETEGEKDAILKWNTRANEVNE